MKKQYIFIIMILIILYITYLIISFSYKEYKISSNIDSIKQFSAEIEKKIEIAKQTIKYKTSKAYKNKILKEQQSMKNKWEKVVFLTKEEDFKKYTNWIENLKLEIIETKKEENKETIEMSVFEKWMWKIFKIKKDD